MLRSLLPWEKVAEGRMRGGLARLPLCGAATDSFSPKGEAFQRLRVSLRSGLTHLPFGGTGS